MKKAIFIDLISASLLLLFLYTAVSKLIEYERFRDVLSSSPLLKQLAGFIAWLLPTLEIVIALFLFIPATRLKGLLAGMILLIILTVYLIYMVLFTPHLPCNCGGVLKYLSWSQHILFNLFFIVLSFTGILLVKWSKPVIRLEPT